MGEIQKMGVRISDVLSNNDKNGLACQLQGNLKKLLPQHYRKETLLVLFQLGISLRHTIKFLEDIVCTKWHHTLTRIKDKVVIIEKYACYFQYTNYLLLL